MLFASAFLDGETDERCSHRCIDLCVLNQAGCGDEGESVDKSPDMFWRQTSGCSQVCRRTANEREADLAKSNENKSCVSRSWHAILCLSVTSLALPNEG